MVQTAGPYTLSFYGKAVDKNTAVLQLRVADASGPVRDGRVELTATMPAMPGMLPIRVLTQPGGAGEYTSRIRFPHGGEYQIAFEIARGGTEVVRAEFSWNPVNGPDLLLTSM